MYIYSFVCVYVECVLSVCSKIIFALFQWGGVATPSAPLGTLCDTLRYSEWANFCEAPRDRGLASRDWNVCV